MIIPIDRLSQDTLKSLIEEFITREGTDYGINEINLPQKVEQVEAQLRSGDVLIIFDGTTESVNLMTKEEYQRWSMSME